MLIHGKFSLNTKSASSSKKPPKIMNYNVVALPALPNDVAGLVSSKANDDQHADNIASKGYFQDDLPIRLREKEANGIENTGEQDGTGDSDDDDLVRWSQNLP
jgi:hypothetical protein